jgi:hypothetical protein
MVYGELGLFNGYRVRRPEPKVQQEASRKAQCGETACWV